MPLVVQPDGTVAEGPVPPGGATVLVLYSGEIREAWVTNGAGGSAGQVDREKLQYDNLTIARRAVERSPVIAVVSQEASRTGIDTVTAAVLGQANEVAKRATETSVSRVTGTALEVGDRATDAESVVAVSAEIAKRAVDAATAIITPTADIARRAVETSISTVMAILAEAADRATENIQAVIAAAQEFTDAALDMTAVLATYAGYANANVSTTTWTTPANFLGNATSTSALLTATSSGLAGITSNTSAGIIDVGFADPQITDLDINSAITINVERAIVSSGTLPLGQSANLAWQYTLDGTTWVNIASPDIGAVAKGIISATLGAAPASVNLADSGPSGRTLSQIGSVASVTSPISGFGGAAQVSGNTTIGTPVNYLQSNDTALIPAGAFSIEARIRPSAINAAFNAVVSMGYTGQAVANARMAVIGIDQNGKLQARAANSGGTYSSLTGTTTMVTGTDYVIQFAHNGTTGYLFLNGSLEASLAFTPQANAPAGSFRIAADQAGGRGGDFAYNGIIDEVRISSVARNTVSYAPAAASFSSDASTLALYHLDQVGGGGGTVGYAQLNNLRVRGNGSVTSGTGLSARLQAQAFRTWVSFTSNKNY